MAAAIYLDTNVCIDALKQPSATLRRRMEEVGPSAIKVPAIVKAELLLGAEKSSDPASVRSIVEAFVLPFEVVPFDEAASEVYARVRAELERRGRPIGPNDLIVSATVLARGGRLVTANRREFDRVPGLQLEHW